MKRIGNAFKGILGGFVFILIGIVLLWFNEGNNVKNIKTTAEMEKAYIDVKSDLVDPQNEGKLIATSGKLINEEELTDSTFNVTIKTPLMQRVVEVYQWVEESNSDEDGGTSYYYKKEWSSTLINSNGFNQRGHDNPVQKLYENETWASSDVKVGAFTLSSNQIDSLSTEGTYSSFDEEKAKELNLTIYGNYLTNSADLNNPQIGDTRISFVYNNSTDVSILAVQSGNTFVDFVSKAGKQINRIMDGTHSGSEMIDTIKKENNVLKWILRAAGLLLIVVGFATILKPISAITSYVPILGSLVNTAVGLVSFVLGLCLGLIVIAVAWIRFRPILGISLLAVVVVLAFFLIKKGKKSPKIEENPTPQQNEMPEQTEINNEENNQ